MAAKLLFRGFRNIIPAPETDTRCVKPREVDSVAQFTSTRRVLPHELLDHFQWEVATRESPAERIARQGWPNTSSRDSGCVGGRSGARMVKVTLQYADPALADGSAIW